MYLTSPTSSISLLPSSDGETSFNYFTRVLNMLPSQRPYIISDSYGTDSDSDAYFGAGYVEATDSAIMQLGLVGVTVIASSGDNGASGGNSACTNPPPAQFGVTDTSLLPEYPASSPYVLTVGATDFAYGLGADFSRSIESFQAQYTGKDSTPAFCGQCNDGTGNTIACQSRYVAEQAVSVNASASAVNSASGHHTVLRHLSCIATYPSAPSSSAASFCVGWCAYLSR